MARATKQNSITSPEKTALINRENIRLKDDFLMYLKSTQKSDGTIHVYENDLLIAFTYILDYCNNKSFVKLTKRDIISFQNWLVNEHHNSPARVRRIKATLSSLSNYIESICDEDYPDFRNIIHKIESPVLQPTREKTVLSDEQVKELLQRLHDKGEHEKACMLALAAYSGRRKAELILFKVNYFDKENIVYGSLIRTPEKIKTKGRGGGKYLNCYVLDKEFRSYFEAWMIQREKEGIQSEWLFPLHTDHTKHIGVTTLNSWSLTFSRMLGVDFYFHSLRHFFTTSLIRAGLPEAVVTLILGWSSADMCRLYTDISPEEQIGAFFDENGVKAKEGGGGFSALQ